MNSNDNKQDDSQLSQLPANLVAALERARQRTASADLVDKVAAQATKLDSLVSVRTTTTQVNRIRWVWVAAIAASVALILTYSLWPPPHKVIVRDAERVDSLPSDSIHSPITKVSLTLVGYHRIEQDLDHAQTKVEEVCEAIALASIRREIQATLDEFYNWRD